MDIKCVEWYSNSVHCYGLIIGDSCIWSSDSHVNNDTDAIKAYEDGIAIEISNERLDFLIARHYNIYGYNIAHTKVKVNKVKHQ